MSRERMSPGARRDDVLTAALRVATKVGYRQMTRDQIAAEAGCSPALVSAVLGTMTALRRQVMRSAVVNEVFPVIAQGLAARDVHAMKTRDEVRKLALEWILNIPGVKQ